MKKLLAGLFFLFLSFSVSAACNYYLLDVQSSYTTLPSQVFSGDTLSLNVPLKNNSLTCAAEKVSGSIALNDKYFEAVSLDDAVSQLNAGDTKSVSFTFKVKGTAPPGTYKVPLKLTYANGLSVSEETFELSLDVLACYSLDVENIVYAPESVYAGESVKLSAGVRNSCSGAARDVSVQLKPVTNSSFDPFIVLSSNVLQVGTILPNSSVPVSFELKPIKDAGPQIYVFKIDANCYGCDRVFSDTVSFEVLAKPELIFSGVDFSNGTRADAKDFLPGDSFSFSVQLDNIGKKAAKAVKVSLVLDGQIVGSKENFVGNIDPSDSGSSVFDLTVLQSASVGEHKAVIVVGYLDETGQGRELSQDYSFYVSAAPSNLFGWIVLLVLLIVVLVVLFFLVKMVFRQLALQKGKLK